MGINRCCDVLGLWTAAIFFSMPVAHGQAQSIEWTRQLGYYSVSRGVSADGLGNVYFSGYLDGANGFDDAFIRRYDAAGNLQWTRQLGTTAFDDGYAVSADGLGSVYISGYTSGSLGGPHAGLGDAFVSKYDAGGNLEWTRQFGTGSIDSSRGVSADGLGSVYISGQTKASIDAGDAFINKYDSAGNLLWTRTLGTRSDDLSTGVSADGLGNVYISGYTRASLGGTNAGLYDAFASKYDAAGNLAWTRQWGTATDDFATGVSADGLGNVYLTGWTQGSVDGANAGGADAFINKYDAAGNLQWIRQLGTDANDYSFGVSADVRGNIYLSGFTYGSLGEMNGGGADVFVSKYDAAGNRQWITQLGFASAGDFGRSVSADGLGNVYFSGYTFDGLSGSALGGKINDLVPEPTFWPLAMMLGVTFVLRRRHGSRNIRTKATGPN